jgi:hypothetical protein
MKNLWLASIMLSISTFAQADDYISVNNYIQNPYNNQISAGGRNFVTESDIQNKS